MNRQEWLNNGKYVQFLTRAEHMRYHNKGKEFSEDHRQKLSANNAWKGKHLSEETRRKISEAVKGTILSDETKRKMSETQKARMKVVSDLWKLYKQLHPESIITFNAFQQSLRNN